MTRFTLRNCCLDLPSPPYCPNRHRAFRTGICGGRHGEHPTPIGNWRMGSHHPEFDPRGLREVTWAATALPLLQGTGTPHTKVWLCGGCFPERCLHPVDPKGIRATRGQPPNGKEGRKSDRLHPHRLTKLPLQSVCPSPFPPSPPES